jgi:hypothetical protein
MRNVLSSLSTALSLGIVLALLAAGAPAAYAASGTAPPAPSSRSSTPLTPHENAKGTQALCVLNGMPYSGATWMHDIAPCLEYRKLSEIAIPGSHDSATYAFTWYEDFGYATTQDEDITHQLDDGMRELDIRVDYHDGFAGPAWYVVHGPVHSHTVTLAQLYTQIFGWAVQPGHGQEIIKLNLSITGGDDKQDCSDFGYFGNALVTPQDLVDHFGTTNPGELTLGQLWSLPDSYGIARVIMSNIPCLQEATGQILPEWGDSGGYYAEQCSADGQAGPNQQYGIIAMVLPAAVNRYTAAGGIPQAWGPSEPAGNLYELDIQGTPEKYIECAVTPLSILPDEKEVIQALFGDLPAFWNLNYVAGDFVEQTDLLKDIVSLDTWPRLPDAPRIDGIINGDSGQLWVSFHPPENYGTAPITSYTVTATDKYDPTGNGTVSGDSSPLTVKGLRNGDTYDITVTATSAYGTSDPSATWTITVGVGPRIVSLPAANGIVGEPYSSGFGVTGTPLVTLTLIKGNLPPGLTLYSDVHDDWVLTGTPTTAGSYRFSVMAKNLAGDDGATVTITISAGVSAKIAGCSGRTGNNAWGCALDVTLPSLSVDTVFSVDIGGGGFTNPSGVDRPQVIAFKGCQVAPIPSPYYPGNGGYNHYDVNISTGGCTDGAVVVLEEAVTAAAGATITQSVTVPGLNTSTDTFELPPQGEPESASPAPSWSQPHRPRLNCSGSRSSAARIAAIIGGSCAN